MPIDLTIVKSPETASNESPRHTFSENGGSIGRGANNAWVLDDPEKYMSSVHARIDYEDGQYTLTDLSTNGTFVNGSVEPLGGGNKVTLNEGDRFGISDYEFAIAIREADLASANPYPAASSIDPFTASPFPQNDPFASPAASYMPSQVETPDFSNTETDPLALLDKASTSATQEEAFFSNTFANNGDALNDAVQWPDATTENNLIPDNWDDDLSNQASPPAVAPGSSMVNSNALTALENECRTLKERNKQLSTELAMLRKTLGEQAAGSHQANRAATLQDATLIEAMGLTKWNLNDDKVIHINGIAGQMVRETMEGMMQVLSFRKKIKEEFRINVTTIQPIENNPLKFSANIEDAMENMFIKENDAYKAPLDALREGFQGISEHQVAVLAGMQAAFRGMLERLDPETLEQRFEKYKKSGVIQLGMKRKHWESYKDYHAEMTENLDNSFQHLFGYDFVQAYEEQMQRLVAARKPS
ncbi:MAG: type VI secretion system-associated FHA domain protein TagH [Gammaproteobacteria bacterium]|nr:type VI secretion system-associated FHA domain protein TagH [Gammaproteobacteria bacterium]